MTGEGESSTPPATMRMSRASSIGEPLGLFGTQFFCVFLCFSYEIKLISVKFLHDFYEIHVFQIGPCIRIEATKVQAEGPLPESPLFCTRSNFS